MPNKLSQVPYFVEAMRNWAMDAGYTPHLLVDTTAEGLNLPFDSISIENDMILLNIHERAVSGFEITNEWVMFSARFSRRSHQVDLPVNSVISVLVPETSDKIVFRNIQVEIETKPTEELTAQTSEQSKKVSKKKGPPHLTLVE